MGHNISTNSFCRCPSCPLMQWLLKHYLFLPLPADFKVILDTNIEWVFMVSFNNCIYQQHSNILAGTVPGTVRFLNPKGSHWLPCRSNKNLQLVQKEDESRISYSSTGWVNQCFCTSVLYGICICKCQNDFRFYLWLFRIYLGGILSIQIFRWCHCLLDRALLDTSLE